MQLILVRHGQTASNIDGLLDTALPGAPLTEQGRRQARALVDLLTTDSVESVTSSQALRAQQTAAPLAAARNLPVRVREGLTEIAAGAWEMSGERDAVRGWLGVIAAWMEGDLEARTPGPLGESGHDCLARFDRAIAGVSAEGADHARNPRQAHVVVAHGAIIRTWASLRATNLDPGFGAQHPLANTAVVRLTGDSDRGWVCTAWGENQLPAGAAGAAGMDPTAEVLPAP